MIGFIFMVVVVSLVLFLALRLIGLLWAIITWPFRSTEPPRRHSANGQGKTRSHSSGWNANAFTQGSEADVFPPHDFDVHGDSSWQVQNMTGEDWTQHVSFDDSNSASSFDEFTNFASDVFESSVNPANGLPMVGSVDIEGNPFGSDFNHDHFTDHHASSFHSGSGFND